MHHSTCVTHVPWCMSGSLTRSGGGKRSRHSWRMRNPQFYVSGKRPIPGNTVFILKAYLDCIVQFSVWGRLHAEGLHNVAVLRYKVQETTGQVTAHGNDKQNMKWYWNCMWQKTLIIRQINQLYIYIYVCVYSVYMWQMSSVFSHESAQRNGAGHLICENVFKTTRPFCYQWFRVSTRQAMLITIHRFKHEAHYWRRPSWKDVCVCV